MKRVVAAALSVAAILAGSPAAAATVVETYHFEVSDFPPGAPADPMVGSLTVTFDPDGGDFFNRTTGITLHSLNVTLGSPVAFSYFTEFNYFAIGGSSGGTNAMGSGGGGDFTLIFNRSIGGKPPRFILGSYMTPSDAVFRGATGVVSAVPETATWAMMLVGFFGAGSVLRRSRRTALLTA